MSAIVGDRDVQIMGTVPRFAAPIDRALLLTPSATLFEVSFGGAPTPAAITFSALMLGAVGDITFFSEPPMPLTVSNGDAVLKFEDMNASIVTVTAVTVIDGLTYHARQTVAKQQALDLRPPPAPMGLVATGTPATIVLRWDAPPANYNNLSHTEVWRAPVNNFAQAALIGRADGREYIDAVGPGVFRYYWIRYVSRAAIPGPYNASFGTVGASDAEVEHLLDVLTGEVTQSQLHADLGERIALIDPLVSQVGDLKLVYGDTVSAAASAAGATVAAAAALLARQQADSAAGLGGEYAAQSLHSATTASTAASVAATYRDESSQAANSATGSAAAAQSSAGIAANAAFGANSAVGAASGSASTAAAEANAAKERAVAANASATTAGTKAVDAGLFAGQAAASETRADGYARAASDFFQQAQATLKDPISGLVSGVAAVKAAGEATADSVKGLKAKYSIKLDVGNVVGGMELLGGGGTIDFAIRASTFSIAAPAGSNIPTSIPFIVRSTETVIDGVTIPIGVYIANAFIQNASITNAKIGGDIWSSNWAPGTSGWYLSRAGDFQANNVRLRGDVASGAFTGYAWPSGAGTGCYLGQEGLRLGNISTGRYFEASADGTVSAPGFSIVNGAAVFSGALSAASGTLGTITSGYLRNSDNSAFVNLNASGNQTFIYGGGGKITLNADGSGYFARSIISAPQVIATTKTPISVGWVGLISGRYVPFTVYIDTGVTFEDPWYSAPSDTFVANATISGGQSLDNGCAGYTETTIVVGGGLTVGSGHFPLNQRVYLRVTWTPVNGRGRFIPEAITWKLVKV